MKHKRKWSNICLGGGNCVQSKHIILNSLHSGTQFTGQASKLGNVKSGRCHINISLNHAKQPNFLAQSGCTNLPFLYPRYLFIFKAGSSPNRPRVARLLLQTMF